METTNSQTVVINHHIELSYENFQNGMSKEVMQCNRHSAHACYVRLHYSTKCTCFRAYCQLYVHRCKHGHSVTWRLSPLLVVNWHIDGMFQSRN